jgi:membrane-associated phospholipid phosphatase
MLKDIFNYNPQILFITSLLLFLIYQNIKILIIYIIGYVLNRLLNILLRNIIKDTRLTENGKEKYNMPSGHSQTVIYSLVFITIFLLYINVNNINNHINNNILYVKIIIIILYSFLSLVTLYNCIKYNYHTKDQVFIGSLIGGIFAYLILFIYKTYFNIKP